LASFQLEILNMRLVLNVARLFYLLKQDSVIMKEHILFLVKSIRR
jgi:hypothetical protein